jgi:hypothetical protein
MAVSKITTISGKVTQSVVLGQHGVRDTLVVTDTGVILPEAVYGVASSYGAAGIVVRPKLDGASITNMGTVSGGVGRVYGQYTFINCGIGIEAAGADTTIENSGLITGGLGGYTYGSEGTSGIGVDLTGGGSSLLNHGEITGGVGVTTIFNGGDGGTGVSQTASGMLVNDGLIAGGNGGAGDPGAYDGFGGNGGLGLDLSGTGAIAINNGVVSGGTGGFGGNGAYADGNAGDGVAVTKGAAFSNYGTVTGEIGIDASRGAVIVNDGTVLGDRSYFTNPAVNLAIGSTLTNNGIITGGQNVMPDYYRGQASGDGVDLSGGCTVTNHGTITGGTADDSGQAGIGVSLTGAATVVNSGIIAGGSGMTIYGLGIGGNGLQMMGGQASNSGTIFGGASYGRVGYGGTGAEIVNAVLNNSGVIQGGADGGIGAQLNGGSIVNDGTIRGGNGAYAHSLTGAGVVLASGTLTNAGTIAGGIIAGQTAAAAFVSDGTLAIDPGAAFIGVVDALPQYDNVLQLAGSGAGVLTGLGRAFTGFTTVDDLAGANWALTGSNVLSTASTLSVDGSLTVTGSLVDTGVASVSAGGSLLAAGAATVQIGGIELAGGRLVGASGSEIVVGSAANGAKPGQILVEAGAAISGSGAVNGALGVVDNGLIAAQGGTLTVGIPVSGKGTLDIGNGATLQTGGAVQVPSIVFAAGSGETLYLAKPGSLAGTLSGFGTRDAIDLKDVQATSASFLAGTLTLLDGTGVVGSLDFAGNYDTANFALMGDQHGGTIVDFVADPGTQGGQMGPPEPARGAMRPIEDSHGGAWLAAWPAQPFR